MCEFVKNEYVRSCVEFVVMSECSTLCGVRCIRLSLSGAFFNGLHGNAFPITP